MSVTTNRALLGSDAPSFSFGRFAALIAGTVTVGVETFMARADLRRSFRADAFRA